MAKRSTKSHTSKVKRNQAAKNAEKKVSKRSKKPFLILAFDTSTQHTGFAARMSTDIPIPGGDPSIEQMREDDYFERAENSTLPPDPCILYCTLDTPGTHLEDRCGSLYQQVSKVFDYYDAWRSCHEIQVVVALEAAFSKRFVATYAALKCAQISVSIAAKPYGFPIRFVNTQQTRAAYGLVGKATKADIKIEVLKRYGSADGSLKSADDNTIDAIAIADAMAAGFHTKKSIRRIN